MLCILYNSILEKTIVETSETDPPNHFSKTKNTMKPIFAHFLKIEFSVIFWRLTKNSRNWFIFHAKIDRNCNFFGAKNPTT